MRFVDVVDVETVMWRVWYGRCVCVVCVEGLVCGHVLKLSVEGADKIWHSINKLYLPYKKGHT